MDYTQAVAHISARGAALFALFVFLVLAIGIWMGMREDRNDHRDR